MCGNCARDLDTKGEERKGPEDGLLNTAGQIRHRSKQRGDGRGTCDRLRHKEKGQICRLAQEHKCKQTTENYYEPYSRLFRSHGDHNQKHLYIKNE